MHWFRPALVFIGLAMAMIAASPSFAQLNPQGTGLNQTGAALQHTLKNTGEKAEPVPPPVLPGTKAPSEAAQPTIAPSEMTPTEALFDAINRGDLPAARDAVNRGGELNGRNVLGMTPLDLSVDLGRNDISFMLLSMRADTPAARAEARVGAQHGMPPTGPGEMPRTASRPRVITASSRTVEVDEPVYATPRYSSGNGGAPIPAAGFVGFGH